MSENQNKKRERGANYTPEEKALLADLIKQYKHIIENKRTGTVFINKKKEAWIEITRKYNSNCTSRNRGTEQLKSLYDNMKQKARKNVGESNKTEYIKSQTILQQTQLFQENVVTEADLKKALENVKEDKVQMNKTGGGFWKPKVTDSDTKILAIIQDQVEPLSNPYDSGAVYFKDDTGSQAENILETNNLAQGSPTLDHYYQEIVIDDSQPEQYPSPAPTTENVPRYLLVPSTSFDSPKHGMDANKTGQDKQNQHIVTTPSRVLTQRQRIVRKTKEVPTVQKKLKKPTSIAAYKRTYRTPVQMLYPLAGIAPPVVRRTIASSIERAKLDSDPRHPMHCYVPVPQRLKSRNNFYNSVKPITTEASLAKVKLWEGSISLPLPYVPIQEKLPPGLELPRSVWRSLNRLRTQVGRSKDNRFRWGFTNNTDLTCRCGFTPQTMAHLTDCSACPDTCTREDLMLATDNAVRVAQFWANDI